MESLLISACLLGADCKYSGGNNRLPDELLRRLKSKYRLVPVCPETAGGLPIPRQPSERLGEKVVSRLGADVTAQFQKGAETALELSKRFDCKKALLKENSPSCGSGRIYDGSFSRKLTEGDGVAAAMLKAEGLAIYGESVAETIL